jgi:heme/copper-type cytochrome/quinol oxidase subunit 4
MPDVQSPLLRTIARLWRTDRPLTFVGLVMVAALLASGAAVMLDARTITGAPAWLKPAKFALSTAIYSFTLAWVFTFLPEWPRMRRAVSWTTAVVFVLEVAIIDIQAWRGTTSHFNISSAGNAILFAVMGTAIAVQTVASAFVAVALWRQHFDNAVMGSALRAGMIITLVGASSGGLMTTPTSQQLSDMRAGSHPTLSGAHTVGAPDGGPGIPVTGWSREHGDLRAPHFLGLHALQLLPLLGLIVQRRSRTASSGVIRAVAVSYAGLFTVLLIQALRGEALLSPGSLTLGLFLMWALMTATALWVATRPTADMRGHETFARS